MEIGLAHRQIGADNCRGSLGDIGVVERANLLELLYRSPGWYAADPSQIIQNPRCYARYAIDPALAHVPRSKFDYLWLVDTRPYDAKLVAGMQPVWRGPGAILYRINP